MQRSYVLTDCSNEQLLAGAQHLVGEERKTTAYLIAHLAEIDARGLHLVEGFSCLSKYCMEALGLSEDASYRRADAAFIAQRYPVVLEMLAEGSIHLTTLRIIGGCLTNENHKRVLNAARHKSKSELELLKVSLCPQPDVPALLRKLPGSEPALKGTESANGLFASAFDGALAVAGSGAEVGAAAADSVVIPDARVASTVEHVAGEQFVGVETVVPGPPPVRKLTPLSPQRYKLQITVDEETYHALRQLQDLLRHQVRNGDLAVIVKDAVLQRLERVQRERFGQVKRPRKMSGQTAFITDSDVQGGSDTQANSGAQVNLGQGESHVKKPDPHASCRQADPHMNSSHADSHANSSQNRQVNSRHIPVAVKRTVWKRDQGRCAFVSSNGRRCSERGRLEYHHVKPYALGGPATIENIALRCRAHNAHEGVQVFGENGKKLTGASASAKLTRASVSTPGASVPGGTGAGASDG